MVSSLITIVSILTTENPLYDDVWLPIGTCIPSDYETLVKIFIEIF